MDLVNKVYNEFNKNGFYSVTKKSYSKLRRKFKLNNSPWKYLSTEEPSLISADVDKLLSFKDKYKGQRCFIIGNGPSLNKIDLSLLKNEITFAVNGIFYKTDENGFVPTFYMVEDSHVVKDNLARINEYMPAEHKFFPTDYKDMIFNRERTSFFTMNRGFYEPSSPNFRIPRFSTDFSLRGYCGQSVTILNLQLAYYMGFEKVYLIGMDFSYSIPDSAIVKGNNIESTEDDVNHFHPSYFGKGKKWHDPQLEQVLKNYELSKKNYEWSGREIFNATLGGNLEIFKRVDYFDLF